MSTLAERFHEIGLTPPNVARADLPFAPCVRVGDILYISGQIPERGDDIAVIGKVGEGVSLDEAREAAELCAANALFWLDRELRGDLDRVVRIAKVTVYVNAAPGFSQISQVGNGASELFLKILGTRGEHARSALGMAALPLNVPVEVDAIVHVR
ncbi:RidA family protein [Labrys sp. LIt4]|uniref:RidA family protein n=1 Tax=Labrys sp. LIt4 TaxID=2821355 RepID=UPI001AE04D06|nr:RidA family protein [Labrys sp. LIt4]MBP0578232.1 RidA family protein [Labrys sp. LIt4]